MPLPSTISGKLKWAMLPSTTTSFLTLSPWCHLLARRNPAHPPDVVSRYAITAFLESIAASLVSLGPTGLGLRRCTRKDPLRHDCNPVAVGRAEPVFVADPPQSGRSGAET